MDKENRENYYRGYKEALRDMKEGMKYNQNFSLDEEEKVLQMIELIEEDIFGQRETE